MRCVAFRHDTSMHIRGRIVTDRSATHEKRIRVGRALTAESRSNRIENFRFFRLLNLSVKKTFVLAAHINRFTDPATPTHRHTASTVWCNCCTRVKIRIIWITMRISSEHRKRSIPRGRGRIMRREAHTGRRNRDEAGGGSRCAGSTAAEMGKKRCKTGEAAWLCVALMASQML